MSTFGHCKDCRYFHPDYGVPVFEESRRTAHGLCSKIDSYDNGEATSNDEQEKAAMSNDGAYADFLVLPDFGCALFEKAKSTCDFEGEK